MKSEQIGQSYHERFFHLTGCAEQPAPQHVGVVFMASGFSRRFGGNKLLADFHGSTVFEHALRFYGLFAESIAVTRYPQIQEICQQKHVKCILHNEPDRCDTIRLGIQALSPDCCGSVFLPCDQPLLSIETLQTMLLCTYAYPDQVWRVAWNQVPASPIYFPRRLFGKLQKLEPGQGGRAVLKNEEVRLIPADSACQVEDIDAPEDLLRLLHAAANL